MSTGTTFKTLSDTLEKLKEKDLARDNKLVHFYASNDGYLPIDPPVYAKDFECPFCGNKDFALIMINPKNRAWLCDRVCRGSKLPNDLMTGYIHPPLKRSLLWPLFCEINGIGDVYHDLCFEKIEQSQGKLEYLLAFASNPSGIAYMKGEPGTGKTYASMGVCEMFTRNSSSCIFTTLRGMLNKWSISLKSFEKHDNYIEKLMSVQLLVIDDFGLCEMSPKALKMFLDLINSRMQWKNKGTIISTNLNQKELIDYCGHSFVDRLKTAQVLEFKDVSRRIKKPL